MIGSRIRVAKRWNLSRKFRKCSKMSRILGNLPVIFVNFNKNGLVLVNSHNFEPHCKKKVTFFLCIFGRAFPYKYLKKKLKSRYIYWRCKMT